jgi:hypothetical protein
MKTRIWLLLTILLALSLAACQPAAPTTAPGGGTETEAPAAVESPPPGEAPAISLSPGAERRAGQRNAVQRNAVRGPSRFRRIGISSPGEP